MSFREISCQRLYLRQGVYSDFASRFLPEFTPGSIQYIAGEYMLYSQNLCVSPQLNRRSLALTVIPHRVAIHRLRGRGRLWLCVLS